MATIHPSLPSSRIDIGYQKEIQVLEDLAQCLPDGYEVFHEVDWYTVRQTGDKFGEIDLVVLGPTGNVLLVEVKSGAVLFKDNEIYKQYGSGEKNITSQVGRQRAAIFSSLSKAGIQTNLMNCLVLPDFKISNQQSVALPRERIIDSSNYAELGTKICAYMAPTGVTYDRDALRKFFLNKFEITLDLQTHSKQTRNYTIKLSEGLATWVPRIQSESNTYLINATAGSGKTQLALKLLNDGCYTKPLYCCYNRPLAEHIRSLATAHSTVTTFHELCVDYYERKTGEIDFKEPGIYQKIESYYLNDSDHQPQRYDLIIIDESQDLEPAWVNCLIQQLNEDGALYIFSDHNQNIYERDQFDIAGAVTVTCNDNYRSPSTICELINLWQLTEAQIESRNPYAGRLPEFKTYTDHDTLIIATSKAIEEMLALGIAKQDLAVLTWHGQNTSALASLDQIGPFTIRRNTGKFDNNRNQIWTNGEILLETVNRFKGKGAAGIVLTEIDFVDLTPKDRQKLFVGLTRSHLLVTLIMRPESEAALMARSV